MMNAKKGKIHSIQSLGTVDGPGVRFVVFFQGCNLRCKCCHNPDTWDCDGGTFYTTADIMSKLVRYREYFGADGGITISGGEPLLQAEFASDIFLECKKLGINTCLDTSGSIITDNVKTLLNYTDRVLLDIKYTENSLYLENVGCPYSIPLKFLEMLNEKNIATTLRQVIIPGFNNNEYNIQKLKLLKLSYPVIDKIELLPFRKICQTKYDNMGIRFPLSNVPEPDEKEMNKLNSII